MLLHIQALMLSWHTKYLPPTPPQNWLFKAIFIKVFYEVQSEVMVENTKILDSVIPEGARVTWSLPVHLLHIYDQDC